MKIIHYVMQKITLRHMMLQISLGILLLTFTNRATAQSQKLKMPNGQETFFSGMNIAWNNFGNDVSDAAVNTSHFNKLLDDVKASGGNCVRWWLFTNASSAPKFNNGLVSGLGSNSINNIRTVLDLAKAKNMSIVLCLFSFDLLQTGQSGVNGYNNKQMLTTDAGIKACIDKCIVPLVSAIGQHPSIQCWEIFNEPEGMLQSGGWTNERISMYDIQRFVNRAAGAIHRAVPNVYVSNGSKSFFYLSPKIGKNYYTNAELKNAGGDNDGFLDFYMVHYYDNEGGNGQQHSPFHHDASYWQMDKPILVAEFGAKGYNNNFNMSPLECYKQIHARGYVGALSWTYTNHDGFGGLPEASAGLNYLKNNFPNDLIFSTDPPKTYGTNLALSKPVTVSSTEAGLGNTANNATDGNKSTRWSSEYADPQWIQVDLGAVYRIDTLVIRWESAYASAYKVECSVDGNIWNNIQTLSNADGGVDEIANIAKNGRFVKITGTQRASQWGYSLYEIEVYGAQVITDYTEETFRSDMEVFPNPFKEQLTINAPQDASITLIDTQGNIFFQGLANELDTSAWKQGLYLLKIETFSGTKILKIEKR